MPRQLTTFFRLLNEEKAIVIPKVQRDYAYGREDEKTRDILTGMLDSMLSALRDDRMEVFDFVYGGSYESKGDSHVGVIPLDGQQRLTTLYLLHFYASVIGNVPDASTLANFKYETRKSANDFCHDLVTEIRSDLLGKDVDDPSAPKWKRQLVYKPGRSIKELISIHPRFSPAYRTDPTVISMLNVLDAIEQRFRDFPSLWKLLTEGDNLSFYHITLEELGLTDDIYIKMNSRGKKLTVFEIFKADLNNAVRHIDPSLASDLIRRIDTSWMDMVWDNFPNDPARTDSGYLQLMKNLLRLILILHHDYIPNPKEALRLREDLIDHALSDRSSVEFLMKMLDTMHGVFSLRGGFAARWGEFFYHSSTTVGNHALDRQGRVRLFGAQQGARSPYIIAMEKELSVPEAIYFYAAFLADSTETAISEDILRKRFRVIRNLVRANQRAHFAHNPDLPSFLTDTARIMLSGQLPEPLTGSTRTTDSFDSKFNGPAILEERRKLEILSDADYLRTLHFENHSVLTGSIGLFLVRYLPEGTSDTAALFDGLERFEKIFDNDSNRNFESIRVSLLHPDVNYWQTSKEKYIIPSDPVDVIRMFIHTTDDYSEFFYNNRNRYNQQAILTMLDVIDHTGLKDNVAKSAEFSINDWRYYMARYPSSNRPNGGYGCYAWRNYDDTPLEAFILNSSYFGSDNLAWSMMLNIIFSYIRENHPGISIHWDAHQMPLEFTDAFFTLDFRQEGWVIGTSGNTSVNEAIHRLHIESSATSNVRDAEDNTYLFPHDTASADDYIIQCLRLLEKIFTVIGD